MSCNKLNAAYYQGMEKQTVSMRHPVALVIWVLACAVLFGGAVLAAAPENGARNPEMVFIGDMQVGKPVKAVFDLKGYEIAKGAYASINIRFLQKPEGAVPQVKTGYPESSIVFDAPGDYRAVFILNEVTKPSCGGVNAKILLEEVVTMTVVE